jgi:bacterioferritin
MKGDTKVLEALNSLLADELTAVNQYMVHAEMCDNWGYEKLDKVIQKRAISEMKHAEKLSPHFFLEGTPVVSNLSKCISARTCPRCSAVIIPSKATPLNITHLL